MIASTTNRVSSAGNGVTTAFPFAYPYRASADLVVIVRTNSTSAESVKTEGADYTVSGTADSGTGGFSSGTVTFGVAPASGTTVVIVREVAPTQGVDALAGASLPAAAIEGALDRLTLEVQHLKDIVRRTLLQPRSTPYLDLVLPEPSSGNAGQVLGVNALGTGFEAKAVSSLPAALYAGRETIWIPALAMSSRATAGPSLGSVETTTNKVMIKSLDFDAATQEHAQFQLQMPKSWDEGSMTAVFVWSHAAAATFNAVWGIQALGIGDDDAFDGAFGTAAEVTDSGGTTNDLYRSPETSSFSAAGAAENDVVTFQVYRKAADAADTLNVDARLIGVALFITTVAAVDN